MAQRAFVHIGTPKSGTTYLQSRWWHHAAALADRGLLLPGGSADVQFQAAAVVRGNEAVLATMGPRQRAAWDRLLEESAGWHGDVLISQEQLVETSAERAASAVAALQEVAREVHVVVTVRDLVRQLPSAWQQRVKHGSDTTLRRFCQRVMKDDPDFNFWWHQDVPRILERWGAPLPSAQVHVVPLPPPGAAPDLLWERVSALLGAPTADLPPLGVQPNDSLAPGEVELLRRVNALFPRAHHDIATSRRIKGFLGPHLPTSAATPTRLSLPPDVHAWAFARGNRMVDELEAGGWDVVGDLGDLRPDPAPGDGVDPDTVPGDEVAAVAVEVIGSLLRADSEASAGSTPRTPQPAPSPGGRIRSLARRVRGR